MVFLRFLKGFIVLSLVLILQLELFASIRFFGVMPELMLGVAIAAGWNGGSSRGAVVGFIGGMSIDLYLATPLGLSALTYSIIGYLIGIVAEIVAEDVEKIVRLVISIATVAFGPSSSSRPAGTRWACDNMSIADQQSCCSPGIATSTGGNWTSP